MNNKMYVTPNPKDRSVGLKPYNEREKLYAMHFCFTFVSRVCDMSLILFMSSITVDTLFLVAMIGFLSSFFIFLFMPTIGICMDNMKRQIVIRWALAVKMLCLSLAYLCCIYLTRENSDLTSSLCLIALYSIPIAAAVNGLCSASITQSMERDWIVVLSNGDSAWLAVTNSVMRQIDLFCLTFANPLTGALYGQFSVPLIATSLLLLNVGVCIGLFWFLRHLYKSWSVLKLRESKDTYYRSPLKLRRNQKAAAALASHHSTSHMLLSPYLSDFATSGCAGVMTSYSLLYVTVLNFGPLMIVYLQFSGVTSHTIRYSRGGAALIGLLGAFSFPYINEYLGLYATAQLAVAVQAVLSVGAAATFWLHNRTVAIYILIVLVLNAKTWIFDLSVRQIAQETIHESIRGRVNGQWRALMAFFEMTGFGLGLLIPDPQHFWLLASVSALVVLLSFVLFTLSNPFGGWNYLQWDIPTIDGISKHHLNDSGYDIITSNSSSKYYDFSCDSIDNSDLFTLRDAGSDSLYYQTNFSNSNSCNNSFNTIINIE